MDLRVVSFNIRCCDDGDGHSIPERAPRLAAVLGPLGADVMGLQEYRPEWGPFLQEYFGGNYGMYNRYRCTSGAELPESTPILWRKDRFVCRETGCFWLSDTPEKESKGWDELYDCHRICVYAILEDKNTGEAVTFMNTHFGFGDNGQVKSVELVHRYSRQISDHPTVIVGDFNMEPDRPGYQRMAELFTDANEATVRDRGCTFHGYQPDGSHVEHIDYCFMGPGVQAQDFRILRDTVDGKYPSDHYGLFAKVETTE